MAENSRPPTTSSGFVLLPIGIALTTMSHLLHGLAGGLLLGAGIAITVLSAVLLGAGVGSGRGKGQGWLPSRDGDGR